MFELIVAGIDGAIFQNEIWKPTKIIGLLDPGTAKMIEHDQYHVEYFYDVKNVRESDTLMTLSKGTQSICPKKEDIQRILTFSETFSSLDRVLVHCHAGMSRSAAVAISVLFQHGTDPKKAIEQVNKIRHGAIWPNDLIVDLADGILGVNGVLVNAVQEWKEEKRKQPNIQDLNSFLHKLKALE